MPAIILERPLFVRERSDGLYRVSTYLAFKLLSELAVGLLVALVFSLLVGGCAGEQAGRHSGYGQCECHVHAGGMQQSEEPWTPPT